MSDYALLIRTSDDKPDSLTWVTTIDEAKTTVAQLQAEHPGMTAVVTDPSAPDDKVVTAYRDGRWQTERPDVVRPSYYTMGSIEVLRAIEEWRLNFSRGNVVKYVVRAGRKPGATELDDLLKAREYLQREIDRVKREDDKPY